MGQPKYVEFKHCEGKKQLKKNSPRFYASPNDEFPIYHQVVLAALGILLFSGKWSIFTLGWVLQPNNVFTSGGSLWISIEKKQSGWWLHFLVATFPIIVCRIGCCNENDIKSASNATLESSTHNSKKTGLLPAWKFINQIKMPQATCGTSAATYKLSLSSYWVNACLLICSNIFWLMIFWDNSAPVAFNNIFFSSTLEIIARGTLTHS